MSHTVNRVTSFDAKSVQSFLLKHGIVVRYYSSPKEIADCIRVSVGRPEDTDAVFRALSSFEQG
jgi:histidinol-phosphate aminotransferase